MSMNIFKNISLLNMFSAHLTGPNTHYRIKLAIKVYVMLDTFEDMRLSSTTPNKKRSDILKSK